MDDDQLLPEHHVLGGQLGPAGEERPQEAHKIIRRMPISVPPCLVARPESYGEGRVLGKERKSCRIKEDGIFGRDSYCGMNG